MANFFEDFVASTGNFFYAAQDGYPSYRYWYIDFVKLIPQDAVDNQPGFILVDTQPELNGSLSASFVGLDVYNGADNFIIMRYQSPTQFLGLRVNPGTLDQKGIYLSVNNTNEWQGEDSALSEGDIKLNLINSAGIAISAETWPNKTEFPLDGLITVDITDDNTFSVELWDSDHTIFYASASFINNDYTSSAGHFGFFHTKKWDANIEGWDYIMWVDSASATIPPTIDSFSATKYTLSEGQSTSLGWFVSSGDSDTIVTIDNGVGDVDLFGTSAITPGLGSYTYIISAYNEGGDVSASLDINVIVSAPLIITFSADSPIDFSGSSILTWETSGSSVSAFIDNDIGWVTPVSAGTCVVSGLSASTTYTLSAFDSSANFVFESTTIDIIEPLITIFSADTPISGGGNSTLTWETSGASTSAFIDNNVGWVTPVSAGTYEVSGISATTTFTLSAFDDYSNFVTDNTTVTVTPPSVLVFSGDTPISAGDNTLLTWETSGATSAFIDNGVGWVIPVNSGTCDVSGLSITTTYTLSAFDDYSNFGTDSTTIIVSANPQIVSGTFSATSNPTCSGSDYLISWVTIGATSAFINNGIGWIDSSAVSSGSYGTSSTLPVSYTMSAWNDFGVLTSASYIQKIYYRDPIADAGSDLELTATSISGVSATFNASASYDPDGQAISTYQWTSGSDVVSTSEYFTLVLSAGDHEFDLLITDGCGQSGTDSVSASVINLIPPIPIASANSYIVNAGDNFILSGQDSYDPDGSITNYLWELSGTFVSATDVAIQSKNAVGEYTYTLTVTDSSGLSASDTVTVNVNVNGVYAPSANAGSDQTHCMTSGDTLDILLAGTDSLPPSTGSSLSWYQWNLSAFGVSNVSANIATDASEIFTIVSDVSAFGTYNVELKVSASNGIIDTDTVSVTINRQALVSAGDDQTHTLSCDSSFYDVWLSGSSDLSGTYIWYFNNGTFKKQGQIVSASCGVGTFSAGLEMVTTADDGTTCTSDIDSINIVISASSLSIDTFEFNPSFINGTSAYAWSTLTWGITSAVSATIDNSVGWLDISAISSGTRQVSGTDDLTYNISAFDISGCMVTSQAIATINLGTISACKLKVNYISLFGPEHIRWGDCRDINLVDMLPETLFNTDTEDYLKVYQDYLNEMYAGSCGYTLGASALNTCACEVSACLLSAVNNFYEHQTYLSGGISANTLYTPTDDVEKVFLTDFCQVPKTKISVLEKIYRITELFDSDLIPIELIQFYAQNLGYEVGLSRDNIGLDFSATQIESQEAINQKKYLRFMVRNLPTWYKIKTTRNSVKMMLYSFGLVGDFIYYFTRNYRDPETGIGLNSLEYGGQNVNDYGTTETSGFNKYIVTDDMTYKELQELKCNLSQWEEFKNNKKAYFNMLNELQPLGNNDWILTDVNPASVKEDISNIPDDFFSSPHFRLWFDILESLTTGNFTTDLRRQKLISEAIKAIKPINTVFEGITGVYRTVVDLYYRPYSRIRKHISLFSDGYADWYFNR